VPDIDIVWLGTLDARISMNLPGNSGMGGTEPEWLAARDLFFETMDKHDKPYGGFTFLTPPYGSPEGLKKAAERMSFIMVTADIMHLAAMAQELGEAREVVALREKGEMNGVKG
jgi:4-hydroxy-2-oxoheptanedioate aldolase